MYEFVLVTLYTKISKKKICIRVGISNRDQYPHHPAPSAPSVAIFFTYRRIRKKNTIRKTRYVLIHWCGIVIPFTYFLEVCQ